MEKLIKIYTFKLRMKRKKLSKMKCKLSTNLYKSSITDARYVDRRQVDTPRGFPGTSPVIPSANKVSMAAFEAIETNGGNSKKLSTLFMTVGQFLDHDFGLSLHGRCRITE